MKQAISILAGVLLLFILLTYLSVVQVQKTFETCSVVNHNPQNDSVTVIPSTLYKANFLKRWMQGSNYRAAWETPIKVPVVILDTLKDGRLTVYKEGGGDQTHTLKFNTPEEIVYCIRSVNKNTNKVVPDFVRKLNLENIIIDVTSSQHPLAAILVSRLAEEAEIEHTHPRLVYIPEQPFLGSKNKKFGNRLFLFEYESDKTSNWTNYDDVEELLSTEQYLENKIDARPPIVLDTAAYIRLRLFDLIIGDWDRHEGQLGWAIQSTTNNRLKAIPVPADRDNAFFAGEGLLPHLITHELFLKKIQPFRTDIRYIDGYVKNIDLQLLRNVPIAYFLKEVRWLQSKLTEESINQSFEVWPSEFRALDEDHLKKKMLSRIDQLEQIARSFKLAIDEGEPTEDSK